MNRSDPLRTFRVIDFSAAGEMLHDQLYDYERLMELPNAASLMGDLAGELWRSPSGFQVPLQESSVQLRWRETGQGSGIATLRDEDGRILQLSLLLAGEVDDAVLLEILQRHVAAELHDSGFEPAFDLCRQSSRPLLASLCIGLPTRAEDRLLFGLADRCLAACFFRKRVGEAGLDEPG